MTRTRGADTWTTTYHRAHLAAGVPVPATIVTTTPAGRQAIVTLADDGEPESIQVGNLAPVDLTYNQGRVAMASRSDGTDTRTMAIAYNAQGYVDSVTDPLSQVTSYAYDAVGRVTRKTFPDARYVDYTYDEDGNRETVTPPGAPPQAHAFAYDSADRRRQYDPPQLVPPLASPQTEYTYTADHQLDLITRPDGNTIDYVYDATGKLGTIVTPEGSYAFVYEAPGAGAQLDTITDPSLGVLDSDYDGFLMTQESYSGVFTGGVSWTHDSQLRVETESVNGGNTVTITYDAEGVPDGVGALTLTRDPANGLLDTTAVGGLTSTHDHNDFGELTSSAYDHGGATVYQLQLTYDLAGRIKTKTQLLDGTPTLRCYEYDLSGRLSDVYDAADSNGCTGTQIEHYGYDANGNRTAVTNTAGTLNPVDITVDEQDRLIDYGTASFTYTDNGELDGKQDGVDTWDFDYDVFGNLERVVLPDTTDIDYIHDGRNRRVGKRVDGTLVRGFIYGDQLNPVAEVDGTGTIVSRFVYGTKSNVPDYMVRAGSTYRIISDHLGSVVAVVDVATGTIAQQIEYDAWGRVLTDDNPGFQPFGFAGGIYDPDTHLVRFGARDYDPETGRWLAKDPIDFAGGDENLYGYVFRDPVNFYDPAGTTTQTVSGVMLMGGAAVVVTVMAWTAWCATTGDCTFPLPRFPEPDPCENEPIGDWIRNLIDSFSKSEPLPVPPPPDPSKRCREVAAACRVECEPYLGGRDPFPFWNCVNECLERNGCTPGMY